MRFCVPKVLATFIVLLATCYTAHGFAQPRAHHFVVEKDTLERIDRETGERMWQIRHASVWETKKREEQHSEIHPPVATGAGWYYSAGNWLFLLDIDSGVIEERRAFPAEIVDLKAVDGLLDVTMATEDFRSAKETTDTIRYRPGASTPRDIWWMPGLLAFWKDATYLADPIGVSDEEFTEEEHRAAILLLKARGKQEPGNPFYDFFIGAEYDRLGESAEAERHFQRAVLNESAPWTGDIQLAMHFDELGRHDQADVVFDRGLEKLDAIHPTFHQTPSLVAHAIMMGIWSRDSIGEAIADSDYETVDRLQTRTVRLFPYLEGSEQSWRSLAAWFEENDQLELAAKWRQHATDATQSPWAEFNDAAREFDLALALLVGFGFAAWLTAFVIGLRTPPSRRWKWLPRPRPAELVGLFVVLVLPLPLVYIMGSNVDKVGTFADAPVQALYQSWGAPGVPGWLEELEPSPARDTLLAHSREMRQAYAAGIPEPPPLENAQGRLAEAIERDASVTTSESALKSTSVFQNQYDVPELRMLIPPWAVIIALLMIGGALLRSRFPRVARGLRYVIPGGARSAGPLTGVMAGLTIAAIGSIAFGIDSILTRIAQPTFAKFYGLDSIATNPTADISHTWAWVTLAVVLLVHGLTVWLDAKRERATAR